MAVAPRPIGCGGNEDERYEANIAYTGGAPLPSISYCYQNFNRIAVLNAIALCAAAASDKTGRAKSNGLGGGTRRTKGSTGDVGGKGRRVGGQRTKGGWQRTKGGHGVRVRNPRSAEGFYSKVIRRKTIDNDVVYA